MLQNLLQDMGRGELGGADGSGRALNLETDARNSLVIYALLDLYDATGDDNLLRLACRVADNLLAMQTPTGLFPRPEREWARTSDDIPLALLHLAAATPNATKGHVSMQHLQEALLLNEPIVVRDGEAAIPTAPGLGGTLNMDVVERYRV